MLFFDSDQLMLDYSREVRNSYSRKNYLHQQQQQQQQQQLEADDTQRGGRCQSDKMLLAYAQKVSRACVCPSTGILCNHVTQSHSEPIVLD